MILLIDSYDSFTNNLAHLIKNVTKKRVVIIHNDSFSPDEYESFFQQVKSHFEYIVIGPGPGHPALAKDVGIISWVINRIKKAGFENAIPILGICLGFQSLCYEYGNKVERLKEIKHGQIFKIHPVDKSELFSDTIPFDSVRYHSLYVDSRNLTKDIVPLAYCYESSSDRESKILMAMRIKELPLYGVQYHPESICSENGENLILNFTKMASKYNEEYRRNTTTKITDKVEGDFTWLETRAIHENGLISNGYAQSFDCNLVFENIKISQAITPIDICDYFFHKDKETNFVLLNSASYPGEWSIIGFPIKGESLVIGHSVDDMNHITISKYKTGKIEKRPVDGHEGMWKYVASEMRRKYIPRNVLKLKVEKRYHTREIPFFGGFMGLISYEEGQHIKYEKLKSFCNGNTPDLKLIYIERFLIYDHITKDWFLVSLNKGTQEWVSEMRQDLNNVTPIDLQEIASSVKDFVREEDTNKIKFELPLQDIYQKQFEKCQEYLHSGDSYELCLTTQSKIYLPSYIESWDIYKVLTLHKNPSPFSCFMDFDDCCLISSSPERFLSCKEEGFQKVVQLRPIKGTVKNTPEIDFSKATEILKTPKEMGENLMIVDLIRHDLYQFTEDVKVTQLMAVEEYKTVFQLVSVIQGVLAENKKFHGIDILHKSLPPGSMTGAPKRRSVQLLQDIEDAQNNVTAGGRRGIYSGVVGYWSVTDDSDWSVIIRSVFHYKDDLENSRDLSLWRIGAGGAITVLSDCLDEWDEMNLKLTSALQAFN
ncbi:ABZ1 [Candida oxycetoniae]|uniref:aminodeoxychorismate synthase n=1 Tax=Candida oxycetoniae TaxID=497107 RepID=A0AAI9SYI1_9ASCO|nr:ABZ1 [Candida oxycetoniae]KAI3405511.2 ABZ1 [Candida oxycetoniae]